MKKAFALILAALLALSMMTAFAAEYTDKETVKKVQQALNDAGYNCGTPDGAAGKKTVAAITDYQSANGLEPTGVIDDALLISLGLMEGEAAELDFIIGEGNSDYTLTMESSDLPFADLKWGASPSEALAAIGATGDVTGDFTASIIINGFDAPLPIRFDFVGGGLDSVTITAKEGLRVSGAFLETVEGKNLHDFVNAFYMPDDATLRLCATSNACYGYKSVFSDCIVGYIFRNGSYDLGVEFSKSVRFDESLFRGGNDYTITTSSSGDTVYFPDWNRCAMFDTDYSLNSKYDRSPNAFASRVYLSGSGLSVENCFPNFAIYYSYGGKANPTGIKEFLFTVDNVLYQFTAKAASKAQVTPYKDYSQDFYITIGEHNAVFMEALAVTKKTVSVEIRGDNFQLRFDLPKKAITQLVEDWDVYKQSNGTAPFYMRLTGENQVIIR